MKVQRSEASTDVSEFNLTEVGKEKVKLNYLIKTLKGNTSHVTIKNQLKNASKKSTLQVPLEKPQADRIKRAVAYEKATKDVSKWDNIVRSNRSADQIIFPLKEPEYRLESAEQIVKRFQTKNELEQQVADLLGQSSNVLHQEKELTAAEEKALKAMSLEEAKARHAELRKMRMLLSFKEAKARRQKKIKSKKYHRILKKEKMRKLMKEFEELQKNDPAAAEEKIKEADQLRILERMTLKHRSTGKWAKQQKIRAKYNTESRKALKEQMTIGRSLTEKVIPVSTPLNEKIEELLPDLSEDDDDGNLLNMYIMNSGIDVTKLKEVMTPSKTEIHTISPKETYKNAVPIESDTVLESEEDEEGFIDETLDRKRTLEDFENLPGIEVPKKKKKPFTKHASDEAKTETKKSLEFNFGEDTVCLDSLVPDEVTFGDEGLDDEEGDNFTMTMSQAFADEDVISEFKEEKKAVINKENPVELDLFMPGWGSWGGTNINPTKRKRKRFYTQPKTPIIRKDDTLGNVIISEEKDKKAAVHQVSELPFPYTSIDQFHSVIRQPIGRTWNPEISFQKLIAPSVVTKLGKIIDPIDANDVEFKSEDNKPTLIVKKKKKKSNT